MDETEPHLLVVDDDMRLRELLRRYLSDNGFRVTTAGNAREARASFASFAFDLIVLDVMMPGESGLELTRELRAGGAHPPILLLTAMAEPEDRVNGLEQGAEDFMAKPFEPRELVLRIRAMLRRAPPPPLDAESGPVQLGALVFDRERAELRDMDGPVRLTGGEAALLSALAAKPNEVLSREDLAAALGMDETGERAIDVQVTRLRRKLEADPREPRFLHTVRGRGYVLKPGI